MRPAVPADNRRPAAAAVTALNAAEELPPLITNCETRVNAALKGKKLAFHYCDDVIWLFRDLARQNPKSLFDNSFLKLLKEAHDKYGFKVQLNCFYRTDFFYGTDEFTMGDMPGTWKAEWQANKDWLKLGLHSLQEFPDYPFVNADCKDAKFVIDRIKGAIARFAGEGVFAHGAVIHKPETAFYRRLSEGKAINSSIGGYNTLTYAQAKKIFGNFKYIFDRETGIGM